MQLSGYRPRRKCPLSISKIGEENVRFFLLAFFMCCYMACGACLFSLIEYENEQREKERYNEIINRFNNLYPEINRTDLSELLSAYEDMSAAGFKEGNRPRWDFAGAFYFVGTVVSTIGFGMTTPRTPYGKLLLIGYGFVGCAGAILFFNLFLERTITFVALMLRSCHEINMRRKGLSTRSGQQRNSNDDSCSMTDSESGGDLDTWKPSVYVVMAILFTLACALACIASAVYHPVEEWSFGQSLYFCFVAFSTIGFGDLVVSQKVSYTNIHFYRFINFFFLVLGCCCVYSLFNVGSIIIKQFLNFTLKKLDCDECTLCSRKPSKTGLRSRRNAVIIPGVMKRPLSVALSGQHRDIPRIHVSVTPTEDGSSSDKSDSGDEHESDLIDMQEFLQSNKITLALMQKHLYETSHRARLSDAGLTGPVGPVAILDKKLGNES